MKVVSMFDEMAVYHIVSDDATKKGEKNENRSTYRAFMQIPMRF